VGGDVECFVGLRVLLKKGVASTCDGVEGTVTRVNPDSTAMVTWDNGQVFLCKVSKDGSSQLLVSHACLHT